MSTIILISFLWRLVFQVLPGRFDFSAVRSDFVDQGVLQNVVGKDSFVLRKIAAEVVRVDHVAGSCHDPDGVALFVPK
ncbi:MAG: hypothetical protein K6A32_02035 [Bacteroidales bacterium]|nr:hypothetical protein [Bacteroidales bacterium]